MKLFVDSTEVPIKYFEFSNSQIFYEKYNYLKPTPSSPVSKPHLILHKSDTLQVTPTFLLNPLNPGILLCFPNTRTN